MVMPMLALSTTLPTPKHKHTLTELIQLLHPLPESCKQRGEIMVKYRIFWVPFTALLPQEKTTEV